MQPVGVIRIRVIDVVMQSSRFLAGLGRAHDQLRHRDQVAQLDQFGSSGQQTALRIRTGRLRRDRGFYCGYLAAFGTFCPRIVKGRITVCADIQVGKQFL